jgi:predicted Zn-dependent protease with MMP-like domain
VLRAVATLPPEARRALRNVALVIEREPTPEELAASGVARGGTLFGLYVGTPLTERAGGAPLLPDRIVIYQGPLERSVRPGAIPAEVARTVRHELAHYFGVEEWRMAELGLD